MAAGLIRPRVEGQSLAGSGRCAGRTAEYPAASRPFLDENAAAASLEQAKVLGLLRAAAEDRVTCGIPVQCALDNQIVVARQCIVRQSHGGSVQTFAHGLPELGARGAGG